MKPRSTGEVQPLTPPPTPPPKLKGLESSSCSASGELVAYEQEGGHCAPYFAVFDETETSIEDLVDSLIPGVMDSEGGKKGAWVKFTVELIEQNTKDMP
jgi:hypothetical protein